MEMVHFIPPGQRRVALLAAQADSSPALISGGDGTGKGAIARWIHNKSPRAGRPFITANHDHPFVTQIGAAQGGTISISEIGEWPLSEQMAILGFLRTKSVRVNGVTTLLNVRVIATTSRSLEKRAQGGLFNPDLLEKLKVFKIEMPPLSKRQEEFEDIVLGLVGEIGRELHREHLRELSPETWEALRTYEWPGNVRELRNVLRVAIIKAAGDRIEASDLPDFGHDRIDFRATREQFEKIYLLELLKTFDWQVDRTCQMSRMDRDTLLSKMRKYSIEIQP
ncbi:MAG: sigma 54-interacting transcriptional regulator [Oligoflexia bacterium]|nr:sigma 54-interacting transcriptional regulator [Oligoflexia bacterium]